MNVEEYAKKHKHLIGVEIPKTLITLLKTKEFRSYADLGCGGGAFLYSINKLNIFKDRDIEVFAVDLSEIRLKNIKDININFTPIKADVTNIPQFSDSSIDFITTTQVIEHVDDEMMLKEIYRILSRNGTVYLTTVFKKSPSWYFYKNDKGESVLDPTHIREYTEESQLFDIAEKLGFRIELNRKERLSYSLLNFLIKKLRLPEKLKVKLSSVDKYLKIPIPRYFIWEIVLVKK